VKIPAMPMNRRSWTVLALLVVGTCAGAADPVPTIPAALQGIDAAWRNFPGAIGRGLAIRSKDPLSDAQWTAIAELPVTSFTCSGAFVDAAGLTRLGTMRVESLVLEGCHADGDSVNAFARMTALRRLVFTHCRLGEGIAQALAAHPALEELTSDNHLIGDGIGLIATSPKLRRIRLGHGAANDRAAKALAGNRTLEDVAFWATGAPVLTEAGVLHLTSLAGVRKLAIHNTVVTYAGSLNRLKALPRLTALTLGGVDLSADDLAQLKADLPQVAFTIDLMTAEQRRTWDGQLAYRLKQEALAQAKAAKAAQDKQAADHAAAAPPR